MFAGKKLAKAAVNQRSSNSAAIQSPPDGVDDAVSEDDDLGRVGDPDQPPDDDPARVGGIRIDGAHIAGGQINLALQGGAQTELAALHVHGDDGGLVSGLHQQFVPEDAVVIENLCIV